VAYQEGVLLRNAVLNAKATNLGATATLKIFSGAEPANCGAADPAGLLATITLPASPFAAASAGVMNFAGTWSVAASATGTAASFRIYDSSANCAMQGNVTTDLVLNNTSINSGQTVTVTQYTLTAGNA
jgi:hypothetical protein